MAKVTWIEALTKLLGNKVNEEVDFDLEVDTKDEVDDKNDMDDKNDGKDESTVSENVEIDKSNVNDVKDNNNTSEETSNNEVKNDDTKENEMDNIKLFEDGWFDEASGVVNFEKIKNPEALAAIQLLTNKYKEEKEQRLISDSLNDTLKEYSLNVSEDTLRKVLDTSGVKIDKDGKVVGIKEAIESLKTTEPGFFKDKEKESNPLNEGFNPVEKKSDNVNSFSQAFRLMDEIN